MLRNVLERRRRETQNGTSTPLGRGDVAFPRVRLVDKHSQPAQIPIYTVSPRVTTEGASSTLRDEVAEKRPEIWLPQLFHQERQSCVADRFVPQRRHRNFDATHHLLTKVPPPSDNSTEVNFLDQIAVLGTSWRKRLTKNALEKADVFGGSNNQRVFCFAERRSASRENVAAEQRSPDGSWKTKARNRPLIGPSYYIIKRTTRSFETASRVLDWGATNVLAVIGNRAVDLFNITNNNTAIMAKPIISIANSRNSVYAIKWNCAGTALAILNLYSGIQIYTMEKLIWEQSCSCREQTPETSCCIISVAWTHNDKQIVVGCNNGCVTVLDSSSGEFINAVHHHIDPIRALVFSPNDRYLASLSYHLRINIWPDLTFYLQIGPFSDLPSSTSLAWHPWKTSILCMGAYPKNGCLSLWDINRPEPLGYREIESMIYIKHTTWNKLSGELVVGCFYDRLYDGELRRESIVAVLQSFDRVVDAIRSTSWTSDLTWNPENTQLAGRVGKHIEIWNFFGNETKRWYDPRKDEEKKRRYAVKRKRDAHDDQTIHFEHQNIR